MSFFSTLKSIFGSAPQPQQPKLQNAQPAKQAEPLVVPASTNISRIQPPRKATDVASGIKCDFFSARNSFIESIPEDIEVRQRLDLSGSKILKTLPKNLGANSIVLRDCEALAELPEGLDVAFLDIQGCKSLKSLPSDLRLRGGGLNMRGCVGITKLPDGMGEVASLDLGKCSGLTGLPDGLKVTSWIDISGTGIKELPAGFEHVGQRENGKVITA